MVEKLDFATIPLYIKIFTVIGLVFGVVGACLSFAGPAVGLEVDPKDLKAANRKQMEEIPEMVAYMNCGDLEDMLVAITTADDPDAQAYLEANTREPSQSLKDYCNDKKAPRFFISVVSGTFTLVGVLTFCFCCFLKRPAPEFVYIVPLILSFVMLYDFLDFNTEVLAYVKDCTLYDSSETDIEDELQFIILWGQENRQTYDPQADYVRLGMMDDCNDGEGGHTCRRDYGTTDPRNLDKEKCYDVGKCPDGETGREPGCTIDGQTISEVLPGCRDIYADHKILCTEYFKCNDADDTALGSGTPCGDFSLKRTGVDDDWKETDDTINDIGGGMIMWFCGSIMNIISMGILACTSFTVQMFVFHGISGVTKIGESQSAAP